MTANDKNFAEKIVTYLDASAAGVKPGTAYRLQRARQEALARLAGRESAAEPKLAGATAGAHAGHGTAGGGRSVLASGRLWLGILLIVAAALGYQQWTAYQQAFEIAETDADLLASDLPIDAYLDQGFHNWLHTVSDD